MDRHRTIFLILIIALAWNFRNIQCLSSEGVSLAFVIDDTGSMTNDINQVKQEVRKIMDLMANHADYPIENIILSIFNDPGVSPIIMSKSYDEIRTALAKIVVDGGGDCPELALTGIKRAIEAALPNSQIYVFTDASAKDTHLSDTVLRLAKERGSMVTFVLTGDCGSRTTKDYTIFEELSTNTKGQLFRLDSRADVGPVLRFISEQLNSKKAIVESNMVEKSEEKHFHIDVDDTMDSFVITVSGPNPKISIKDPIYDDPTNIENILDLTKVKTRKVTKPTPGRWFITTSSSGPHNIEISTVSKLNFKYGFSTVRVNNLKDTNPNPIKGVPAHLFISPTSDDGPGLWSPTTAQIVDVKGKIIEALPLVPISIGSPPTFAAATFIPPDFPFDIVVQGHDKSKNFILRKTVRSIESIRSEPPKLTGAKVVDLIALENVNFELKCEATGSPLHIKWLKNGRPVLDRKYEMRDGGKVLSFNPTYEDKGTYICNAKNLGGEVQQIFNIDVHGHPKILEGVDGINLKYSLHDRFELNCTPSGIPTPRITWLKDGKLFNNGIHKLTFDNAAVLDSGEYTCEVANEYAKIQKTFTVTIIEPPEVHGDNEEKVPVRETEMLNLVCDIDGIDIHLTWRKNDIIITESSEYTISNDGRQLSVTNTSRDDAGAYSCTAENQAGNAQKIFDVEIYEIPTIVDMEKLEVIKLHEKKPLEIVCNAHGYPMPIITWIKSGKFLSDTSSKIQISQASGSDAGEYMCQAKNAYGKVYKRFVVTVIGPTWTEWHKWTRCSKSCDIGFQSRYRQCYLPPLETGGSKLVVNNSECTGQFKESRRCTYGPCPIHGGWSDWSTWSACSATCGGGKQFRIHTCTNPEPAHGGNNCIGKSSEVQVCNPEPCKRDGKWSNWSDWSPCSVSCGGGRHYRMRKCDNPSPAYGGKTCIGPFRDVETCNTHQCPVDGGWSDWEQWSKCTAKCGTGYRQRYRYCDYPVTKYGGKYCEGTNKTIETCLAHPCLPKRAMLRINGMVEGSPIHRNVSVDIIPNYDLGKTTLEITDKNLIINRGRWFPYLPIILSSLKWQTAGEIDGSTNGFTLTSGVFEQETNVTFAKNRRKKLNTLTVSHKGRGEDVDGVLVIDIDIEGDAFMPKKANVRTEYLLSGDYMQIDKGLLLSQESGKIKKYSINYNTTNLIRYNNFDKFMSSRKMQLTTSDLQVSYLGTTNIFEYHGTSSIENDNSECPDGFSDEKTYCADIDECAELLDDCNYDCVNTIGGYYCEEPLDILVPSA